DFQPLRYPAGLYILDVGEEDSRDSERLQILDRRRLVPTAAAEGSVLRLEGPGDEGGEAARLFLQIVNVLEVVHAMLERFAAAEHHGGGGAHAQLVRGAMDMQPIFRAALEARHLEAHFVVEDLSAATGDRIQPRIAQTSDRLLHGELAEIGKVQDLAGAETMKMDLREAVLDAAQQLLVPLQRKIGIQSTLHQNAGPSEFDRLTDLLVNGLELQDVALGPAGPFHGRVEGAKGAVLGAKV